MEHLKDMVRAGARVLSSVLGSLGAGCAAPSGDPIDTVGARDAAGAASGLPAGFDAWLRAQCPDGGALGPRV